ncbi:hypothetical protein LSE82_004834 [Salmonella enterica]|nr:hypothetical protein [Salmonella enterica]
MRVAIHRAIQREEAKIRVWIQGVQIAIIDYSKDLLGIVQNYVSGTKQMVFKNGIIK